MGEGSCTSAEGSVYPWEWLHGIMTLEQCAEGFMSAYSDDDALFVGFELWDPMQIDQDHICGCLLDSYYEDGPHYSGYGRITGVLPTTVVTIPCCRVAEVRNIREVHDRMQCYEHFLDLTSIAVSLSLALFQTGWRISKSSVTVMEEAEGHFKRRKVNVAFGGFARRFLTLPLNMM